MKKRSLIALVLALVVAMTLLTGCIGSSSSSRYGGSSYGGSSYSSSHDCYVCGKSASKKYGSHYYCTTHYAMVKTVVEAG